MKYVLYRGSFHLSYWVILRKLFFFPKPLVRLTVSFFALFFSLAFALMGANKVLAPYNC